MNVKFVQAARVELLNAIEHYNVEREGLGLEFSEDVQATIERIIRHPHAWSPISKTTRRCRLTRFPYGVIYQTRGDTLLIIAVMHLHRDPQSWKTRIPNRQQ